MPKISISETRFPLTPLFTVYFRRVCHSFWQNKQVDGSVLGTHTRYRREKGRRWVTLKSENRRSIMAETMGTCIKTRGEHANLWHFANETSRGHPFFPSLIFTDASLFIDCRSNLFMHGRRHAPHDPGRRGREAHSIAPESLHFPFDSELGSRIQWRGTKRARR